MKGLSCAILFSLPRLCAQGMMPKNVERFSGDIMLYLFDFG